MDPVPITPEIDEPRAAVLVGKYSPTLRLTIILGAALISWCAFVVFAWLVVLYLL